MQIVAPYVGAWIETRETENQEDTSKSHPTWVRGLKRKLTADAEGNETSHPTWVRGLKPYEQLTHVYTDCRTLRGCVD